jgi:hypothetical protein
MILAVAGCSFARATPAPPPAVPATAEAPHIANVPPPSDPVEHGRQLLEAGGRHWPQPPFAVLRQQMSYAEAHKWIPMLSEEGDAFWGSGTPVWLVIFKGPWIPDAPVQTEPQPIKYPGCVLVLFRASDGSLIAAGDTVCPGEP